MLTMMASASVMRSLTCSPEPSGFRFTCSMMTSERTSLVQRAWRSCGDAAHASTVTMTGLCWRTPCGRQLFASTGTIAPILKEMTSRKSFRFAFGEEPLNWPCFEPLILMYDSYAIFPILLGSPSSVDSQRGERADSRYVRQKRA